MTRTFSSCRGILLPFQSTTSKGKRLYYGQFGENPDFEILLVREPGERNFGTRVGVFMKEQRQPLQ